MHFSARLTWVRILVGSRYFFGPKLKTEKPKWTPSEANRKCRRRNGNKFNLSVSDGFRGETAENLARKKFIFLPRLVHYFPHFLRFSTDVFVSRVSCRSAGFSVIIIVLWQKRHATPLFATHWQPALPVPAIAIPSRTCDCFPSPYGPRAVVICPPRCPLSVTWNNLN